MEFYEGYYPRSSEERYAVMLSELREQQTLIEKLLKKYADKQTKLNEQQRIRTDAAILTSVPSVSLDTQIEDHTSESTYLESSLEVDEPQPHTATVVEDIIVSVNDDLELLNNECSITEDTLLPILHYDSVDVQVTTSELVVASNNNFQQYGVCYMPVTHGVCYNSYPLATTITTLCDMRLSDSTIFHAVVAYLTGTHSCVRRVFDPGGYLIQ